MNGPRKKAGGPARAAPPDAVSGWVTGLWRRKAILGAVIDAVIVFGTFEVVFVAWFTLWRGESCRELVPLYLASGGLLTVLWLLFTHLNHGYARGLEAVAPPILRVPATVSGGLFACGVLIALSFLIRGNLLSRATVSITWIVSNILIGIAQAGLARIERLLAARGLTTRLVAIAGLGEAARDLAVRLRARRSTVRALGFLRLAGEPARERVLGIPVLGVVNEAEELHRRRPFDVLVMPAESWSDPAVFDQAARYELLNLCEAQRISFYLMPGPHDGAIARRAVTTFADLPLLRLEDDTSHPLYRCAKRLFDVLVGGALLLAGLPVWVLVAVMVKLSSPGPIFYLQTRIGLHGKPFRLLKFRSMVQNADEGLTDLVCLEELPEPVYKIRDDPRVTSVGRFLRRTGLDEIPQLLNVLAGSMSLVGPRPEEASVVARYNPHQRRRLKVKPGITGLQQVVCRGTTSLARRIAYDLLYMKHQGLLLDLYVILRTVSVVTRGKETV